MSAPPDNRSQQPQRYVSRIEINPVNPADPASGGGPGTVTSESHGKPPVAPKQPQPQATPTKQAHTGNVRHIPIFVEGRDEPLLPKNVGLDNVEQVFSSRVPQPGVEQVFPPQESPHSFGRPPQFASHHQFYPQQQQAAQPPQGGTNFQQPSSPKQQRHMKPQQQKPQPQQQQPQPQPQPPKSPEAPAASDPISRVQTIQKDVEELQDQVNKYSGRSRKDKEYIYLDEMLTRNLLKLDDIDTEGKDNVRQARKEAIRTIQRCISVLEGKVPVLEENKASLAGAAAMDIGQEECQPCEARESAAKDAASTTVETTPAEGVIEVVPAGSATENTSAKDDNVVLAESAAENTMGEDDKVSHAEAGNAAPAVPEQTQGKSEQTECPKPLEEQKMEVAQIGESTGVKSDIIGEVNEQVPMEVDEQKQNPEKSQPVAKAAESKKLKKGGKKVAGSVAMRKDSASVEKSDQLAGENANKVPWPNPVTENTDSRAATTAEAPLAPQPQVENSS
jgi:hypothetical protein